MPNQEITQLQEQLAAHRATLNHLIQQRARFSAGFVPAHIANDIDHARSQIADLKAALLTKGVEVEDEYNDQARPEEPIQPAYGPTSLHIGDNVAGDSFIGDKVMGDQHVHHHYAQASKIDPQQAQQLLESMPLDHVPEPASFAAPSRMELSHNELFVGREAELKALAAALKQGDTTVIAATVGMGGIGKTQLASEFAHRYGQYFGGGVFWLSFAEANNVDSEIVKAGSSMNLAGFSALKFPDQLARVLQCWQEPIPRLLIFDNCEDEALLRKYKPSVGGCRVLVTSRRQSWGLDLGVKLQRLETLPRKQSIELLRKFRPDLAEDDPDLIKLAAVLGDLPLALHVAGSYLKRYQRTVSPAQYLEKLASAPLQSFALRALEHTPTQHERDLARTIALSYQQLYPNDPSDALALAILARAAHLAPGEPIPASLLLACLDLSHLPSDEQELAFDDGLHRLDELGLSEPGEHHTLRLHRLIAAFVLSVSEDQSAQMAVEQAFLTIADNNSNLHDKFLALRDYQIHFEHIVNQASVRTDQTVARLQEILAYCLYYSYQMDRASLSYQAALSIYRAVGERLGQANVLRALGDLLQFQKDMEAALESYQAALSLYRAVGDRLGQANTLAAQGQVALINDEQTKAAELLDQALTIYRVIGDRYSVAAKIANYGWALRRVGRYSEARPYLQQAAELFAEMGLEDYAERHRQAAAQSEPPSAAKQIAEITAQAKQAVAAALADPQSDRIALAQQLEDRARWAEDGETEGSPYLALATELRALIAQLQSG